MKSRKLSLLLAVIMILSSLSVTVFAGTAEDADINPWTSYFTNYENGEEKSNITSKNVYDDVLGATVKQFKTEKYYSGGSAGKEPRQYLVGDAKKAPSYTDLGGIAYADYDYLRISLDMFIGDADDGMAFRMRRRNTSDNSELEEDMYIGIGGSNFTAGTVTNGYTFIDTSLEANQWHNVVIELGSAKSDVKFYVNNKLSEKTVMKKIVSRSATTDVITGFPADTYGFGGGANRCILIPKSRLTSEKNGVNALDLRLHSLTMTATNTEYTPDETSTKLNRIVYEMKADSSFVTKTNDIIRTPDAAAPHITGKTAVHHGFENFVGASSAGSESGYVTLKSGGGVLGNVNYKEYDNLRIQFSIYLNNSSNGVYFRTKRRVDELDWNSEHYIFNIGGAEFNGATRAANGTSYAYTYKGLEVGRWYNVVMEIGANSNNTDVKYYVDGELVETVNSQPAIPEDVYGFGGNSQSWAIFAMIADKDSNLDLYLSDFKMIACTTKYDVSSVPVPSVAAAEGANVGIDGKNVYVYETITNDELVGVGASVVNVVDNEEPMTDWVVAYNDSSKVIKYFDVVKGKLFVGKAAIKLLEETNELNAVANIYNFGNEEINPCVLMAIYKINEAGQRVLLETVNITENITYSEDGIIGKLDAIKAVPDYEYDLIKLLIWDDMGVSIKPMIKAARR